MTSVGSRVNLCSEIFLTESAIEIMNASRRFAQERIEPMAESIDREHRIPKDVIDELGQLGFMGMMAGEEFGGSGLETLDYITALEEVSVACASTAVVMSVNNSLVLHPLSQFGTREQKEKHIPALASGRKIGCYCLSEPGSGSDAAAMKTRAEKKADKWILHGVKNFITNGKEAELAVVYVNVAPEKKHKGVACFLVESSAPGYSVGKVEEKLGICGSSTTQIIFEDVEIDQSMILGEIGDGFKIAMNTLDGGRIGIAAQAVGIARACLEEALLYSDERETFGKSLHRHQSIQNYLADMSTQIDAARLLMRAAAVKKDRGENYSQEAAQAKLFASEVAMQSAIKGVQILGGYGYCKEYPMERHMRDAKITEIYEGTSEIQRLVIASQLVKAMKGKA